MNIFLRFLLVFFGLSVLTPFLVNSLNMQFGAVNFWTKHGIFFLIFIFLFPRLTLFFSSVSFGGILWWLGFFFCPRLLVAVLATTSYWNTNPILVVCSWLAAFGGEGVEKYAIQRRVRTTRIYRHRGYDDSVIDV